MQTDQSDLRLLIESRLPVIAVESAEENRVVDLFKGIAQGKNMPVFTWTVTEGFTRIDQDMGSQAFSKRPQDALGQIRATQKAGIYLLLDFHPYLAEPVNVRMLKEIALNHATLGHTVALVSHEIDLPGELKAHCAEFKLALPSPEIIENLIRQEARNWSDSHHGKKVQTDRESLRLLIRNLQGLTAHDARQLAHQAIYNDGAITACDLKMVMEAKYKLLDQGGVLSFDFDAAHLADIGGLIALKKWLRIRQKAFLEGDELLDRPKGIVLLGVQGCGKSLAAKAVAGTWGLPLLHLDVGTLYNKFFGETERNLRDALATAQVMAPCVLWIDEIEKALAQSTSDGGTSQRVLGSLLTWMAENTAPVFIVATANQIDGLPPELIRKGRVDEIFFVDLPDAQSRREILSLHLEKRKQVATKFDLDELAMATDGFSGAEIEQGIVSALYLAREENEPLNTRHILDEVRGTQPLSVVMAENLQTLRAWAHSRTVSAN